MRGWIKELVRPRDAGPEPLPGGAMEPPRRGGGRIGGALLEPERSDDGAEHRPLMPRRSSRFGISSVVSQVGSSISGLRDLVLRRKS